VPDQLRTALIDAPYRAAERVFDAALREHVDFVVLAGDLVDPAMAGPRGLVFLGEQFRRLIDRRIGVYWALGRSDRLGPWVNEWSPADGVARFANESVERVVHLRGEQPVAQILGTSAAERKRIRLSQFQASASDLFTVAVAHGAADPEVLSRHAVNYWALGGEHERRSVLTGPVVAHYCGTPQGRRPQESGPHGCTLVEVDNGRVRTSFVPTDAVRYVDETVTVAESTTPEQLEQIIGERLAELAGDPFGPDVLVHWTITGSQTLQAALERGALAAELVGRLRAAHGARRPAVWTIAIDPEGAADVPLDRYAEQSLLGEFLRTVRHYAEHPGEPLDLERHLSERHVAGSLASAVALADPAVRERVLAEVARLGIELLGPQGPRP
jgi:DNA repair exonuclease SbcCD nuclease subunit